MENERLKKQLEFCREIDKEKFIGRQTYKSDAQTKENDAEHAWHMAVMTVLLSAQSNCPPNNVPRLDSKAQVRIPISQGWYPNGHSMTAKAITSQCPIYPVHATSKPNIRLQ